MLLTTAVAAEKAVAVGELLLPSSSEYCSSGPDKSSDRILREQEMGLAPGPVRIRPSSRVPHLPARGHFYQHLSFLPSRRPLSRAARGVTDRPTVFFRPGVRRVRVPTDRLPGSPSPDHACPPARALHPSAGARDSEPARARRSRSASCSARPDRPFGVQTSPEND